MAQLKNNQYKGLKSYLTVTAAYWGFTVTDGAIRMLVVLYFYQLGYSPLEIAFLFPWAVVLGEENGIGGFGFIAMMIFLFLLVVGFIYEWRKGALEWE